MLIIKINRMFRFIEKRKNLFIEWFKKSIGLSKLYFEFFRYKNNVNLLAEKNKDLFRQVDFLRGRVEYLVFLLEDKQGIKLNNQYGSIKHTANKPKTSKESVKVSKRKSR